jgi:hypothetical protein
VNTHYITIGKDQTESRAQLITAGWEEVDSLDERFHKHSTYLGGETERVATLGEDGMVEVEVIER